MSSNTLLFADDSATMRNIMKKTFAAEDVKVVTIPSGEAAVAKAKELTPSLIIADAGMAGISGYDVCKSIRSESTLAGTPFIIMSGISNPYDEIRGREVGITEHMKKPFDTTKLIERVRDLTSRQKPAATIVTEPALKPKPPARPLPGATLHAFPSPLNETTSPSPVAPPTFKAPNRPVPPVPRTTPVQPSAKQTMEFSQPKVKHSKPNDISPIEIAEQSSDEPIQVGTLAELAQMDESGGMVQQEVREDAIELNDPIVSFEPSPKPISTSSPRPAALSVKKEAVTAASEIATKIDGLTPEQVEAVTTLTVEVVERIVWEIAPDLAETIIKEHIEKLLQE